jgi:hypothetical protein
LGCAVVSQHGVAALNVLERAQNRFGRRAFAVQFEMPLQVADPQHEFGDGGGAGIGFQPEELVRVNRVGGEFEFEVLAELRGEIEDFAFQNFQMLQGNLKEVPHAARGVEHGQAAEPLVKGVHLGAGAFQVAGFWCPSAAQGGGLPP